MAFKLVFVILSVILLTASEKREKREYNVPYDGFPTSYSSNVNSQSYLKVGQPYVSNTAAKHITYAQWCQDVCAVKSFTPDRTVDYELSPKDSWFYQNTINFELSNCICLEKVPDYQISGLCNYNLKYYNLCDLTCKGRADTKLVDIFGSNIAYIRGTCTNNKCYCSTQQFDYPMKTSD